MKLRRDRIKIIESTVEKNCKKKKGNPWKYQTEKIAKAQNVNSLGRIIADNESKPDF